MTLPPSIKEAIQRKLTQEQEALEYEFRLEKAKQEAEKVRIEAEGKALANRILNASLTQNILREKGIEATTAIVRIDQCESDCDRKRKRWFTHNFGQSIGFFQNFV